MNDPMFVHEICAELRCKPGVARALCKRGGYKLGRDWRMSADRVAAIKARGPAVLADFTPAASRQQKPVAKELQLARARYGP